MKRLIGVLFLAAGLLVLTIQTFVIWGNGLIGTPEALLIGITFILWGSIFAQFDKLSVDKIEKVKQTEEV